MRLFIVILISLLSAGCGARPWNSYHSSLEVLAETVVSVDRGLDDLAAEESDEAIEEVAAEAAEAAETYRACQAESREDCGAEPTLAEYMARYRERVETWSRVSAALDGLRQALLIAEDAAEVWRQRQERPGEVEQVCRSVEDAYDELVLALTGAIQRDRLDTVLSQVRLAVVPLCTIITEADNARDQ